MMRRLALLVLLVAAPAFASSAELAKDVLWANGVISIKPCGLQFTISDHWEQAPKRVASFPDESGFMLGRRGFKDKNGREFIPTLSVFWQELTQIQLSTVIEGQDVDPLMAYVMDNRPDVNSEDDAPERMFIWQDEALTLKYAVGFEFSAVLNKRPSKALVVYTINREMGLGIQIVVEFPDESSAEIQEEMEALLKGFATTSSMVHGSREAFRNRVDDVLLIEFRDRAE